MNISEVGKKIRKWDEVTGNAVEIQISETVDPAEDVGMPSWMQYSRKFRRSRFW